MNRWDLVQAKARDIASNVHTDPELRDAMADDLIELVGMMINATGKIVAGHGERQMNDASDWTFEPDTESIDYSDAELAEQKAEFEAEQRAEATLGGTLYSAGERMQEAADEAVKAATNRKPDALGRGEGVDLERWRRPSPGDPCRCTHTAKAHAEDGTCHGETCNGEPCKGGPCNGYVAAEPTGGWVHVDRRPHALRTVAPAATPEAKDDNRRCPSCNRVERFGHYPTCKRPARATPVAATQPARPCCYATSGPCATCRNGGPVGRCCFPLRDVCPLHH